MSAEILNLDELETGVEKTVVLNGVKHSFAPFSVENFIENVKSLEEYSKREDIPVSEYMEHMVQMVVRGFPSIGEEAVRKLPMTHLKAINEFVRGQTEAEAALGAESVGAEPAKN